MFPRSLADLLPGAWFLLLAGGLLFALDRFYDRLGRRFAATAALTIALALGTFLTEGASLLPLDLLRGRPPFHELAATEPPGNFLEGDLLQLIVPAQVAARRALAAGEAPLWNPFAGTGLPLLADPQAQVLQPLVLAALPLPVEKAAAVTAALRIFLALAFTFLFLRRQGLSQGASRFGAVAASLGAFLTLWLGWPLANAAAWLPGVLYGVARVIDRGGRRDLLLLAGCLTGLLLAGHPEAILYSLTLALAFALARLRRGFGEGEAWRRPAGHLLGGALLAFALAAPVLLPFLAYLPQSLRAERLGDPTPPAVSPAALERAELRLTPLVAPHAFGSDRFGTYWGPTNFNEDAGGFPGTVAWLLVLLALLPTERRRPEERLFLGAAFVALAVVAQLPGSVELLRLLPGGTSSGYHHRLVLVAAFGLVYVAACELDRREKGERGRPAVLAAVALLALALAWATFAHPHPADPSSLAVLREGWLQWQLRILFGAGLALFLGRPRRLLPLGLTLLAALEGVLLFREAHPPARQDPPFPTTAPVAFLAEHLGEGRFIGLDLALLPNYGTFYGLADARVYNPLAPAAVVRATAAVTDAWSGEVQSLGRPEHPLHDLLGVKYVVTAPGREAPPPLSTVFRSPAGNVWERPAPLPPLFLPAAAMPAAGEHWPEQLGANSDFRALALVSTDAPWAAAEPDRASLRIVRRTSTRWEAELEAPESRLLATSITQDGGWRVRVDGEEVTTVITNGAFVGAWLPAGRHLVEVVYRPRAVFWGLGTAGVGMVGALLWMRRTVGRHGAQRPAQGPTAGTGPAATGPMIRIGIAGLRERWRRVLRG